MATSADVNTPKEEPLKEDFSDLLTCTICLETFKQPKKCEQVITIDKAVAGVKESTKAKELMKKLKETSKKLEEIICSRKQNTTNFEGEIDGVLVEIGHIREKINKKLDDLEKRIREEVNSNFISGIFFNDDIIITDYEKNRIVCHDNTGKQTEVLNIPNYPTDITKVNDQKIFIINVKPLILAKTLDTKVPTWGLCLVENEYITANSNTIYWLNAETGAKIKELATGADTRFVTCYKKNEYVYMNNTNSIKLESADGKGFQYTDSKLLSYSYNQEIDKEWNIYVVGYSSNNIHQLTPAGQLIRIIPVSDIDNTITGHPWVMRYKRNTNRFLSKFNGSKGQC
ncbi:unnamed protein product [Mytilus edulis]|uniref:Uncharacterized protein n=1 Tax=Mytilus edulis TaxID=6550 RepID=A0A8S3SQG4_MYTED|nr:unnamed protein product [Mytilus edulis]